MVHIVQGCDVLRCTDTQDDSLTVPPSPTSLACSMKLDPQPGWLPCGVGIREREREGERERERERESQDHNHI